MFWGLGLRESFRCLDLHLEVIKINYSGLKLKVKKWKYKRTGNTREYLSFNPVP